MVFYEDEIAGISQKIKKFRREQHLTVQEVAFRCGIERSNLSRIEAGKVNVTIKTLCLICNALYISLDDLINDGLNSNYQSTGKWARSFSNNNRRR